jgi:hypothetical protein
MVKHIKEEVEQIDELKKSTLANYVAKAHMDQMKRAYSGGQKVGMANAHRSASDEAPLTQKDAKKIIGKKNVRKDVTRSAGIQRALTQLAKEEVEQVDEASYSAKAARAGKDIGKKGKNFEKIASEAGKRYGSAEAGKRVAGAVLAKLRQKSK